MSAVKKVQSISDKMVYAMNEYNNPSFATMFQRALLNTCITTFVLNG
jgi:hypothetical protein